ncbi:DUF421 domain-containing protein [Bombilactobacillus thymidiniphilus]|uniref:DUF421 domain-containing protein n=1 Tax=Bombilactobacillus thymidiniphilus TaxID=2923363 RepID=A0ABY4PE21_9LACO|nr:DUF421 domain-containing protein [Bombilactobacillus thymidiniphilus]UQS83782.1 DUF421 domain-containing protein [Bombilactobacillus thymidiniphilus]
MTFYWQTFLKLLMGFLAMIIQINLLGKSNLAPSNVIDQMQNFVLGGIIGGVLYNSEITLLQFFIVLIIWTLVVFTTKFLTNHSHWIKKFIDGEPTVIISKGNILPERTTKAGISAHDLAFKLRQAGVNDLAEIDQAVWEQNGQLTFTVKKDMKYQFPVIMDGRIDQLGLDYTHHDKNWVLQKIKQQGYQIHDIYLAIVDHDGLRIFPYKSKSKNSK